MEFVRWLVVCCSKFNDGYQTSRFDKIGDIVAVFWRGVSDSLPEESRFRSTKTPGIPYGP